MNKVYIAFLFISFSSCSVIHDLDSYIDPSLYPLFELFKDEAIKYDRDIPDKNYKIVLKENTKNNSPANTITYNKNNFEIEVNKSVIEVIYARKTKSDSLLVKLILYHELGHGFFNYPHIEGSIMSESQSLERNSYHKLSHMYYDYQFFKHIDKPISEVQKLYIEEFGHPFEN